ncbi:hypothetical protein L829_0437 [Mycobacteroides abscessus MAB_030201_1075]|uniref:Uncharacterized protein n=1 Tax=Mycobacteroides abscessus MAB_030201_1075 TaxID=1335410 RepID=A0A829PDX0_9MYCO|nr:hypothetical protein L829_0437 [Mycobacteroides abscessus MAB_030201_1075]
MIIPGCFARDWKSSISTIRDAICTHVRVQIWLLTSGSVLRRYASVD